MRVGFRLLVSESEVCVASGPSVLLTHWIVWHSLKTTIHSRHVAFATREINYHLMLLCVFFKSFAYHLWHTNSLVSLQTMLYCGVALFCVCVCDFVILYLIPLQIFC